MEQHKVDPRAIVLPKVVMAFKSQAGYHTFNCPACDQRNKVHEKRAINYLTDEQRVEKIKERGGDPAWASQIVFTWDNCLHFICVGCHKEVHVDRCPEGGLIVL